MCNRFLHEMESRSPSLDSYSSEHSSEEIESSEEENEKKNLEKIMLKLREEKVTKMLLKNCISNIQVKKTLSKILDPNLKKSRRTEEYLSDIEQLLLEKDRLNADIHSVCEANRNLEEQIRQKKIELKGLVKERSIYWDEAATAYSLSLRNVKDSEPINWAMTFSDQKSYKYFKNEFKMRFLKNQQMSRSISHFSLILHNLICFSGKPWAHDENLSKIVQNTGKILGMNFGAESDENARKALEKFTHNLNNVTL